MHTSIAIVVSEFNEMITSQMLEGALSHYKSLEFHINN